MHYIYKIKIFSNFNIKYYVIKIDLWKFNKLLNKLNI